MPNRDADTCDDQCGQRRRRRRRFDGAGRATEPPPPPVGPAPAPPGLQGRRRGRRGGRGGRRVRGQRGWHHRGRHGPREPRGTLAPTLRNGAHARVGGDRGARDPSRGAQPDADWQAVRDGPSRTRRLARRLFRLGGAAAAQLSHVFSLQRPIDANARESSYLTYQTRAAAASRFQLAAAGMRSNSVCASVVHKAQEDAGRRPADDAQQPAGARAAFASQSAPSPWRSASRAGRLASVRPGRHHGHRTWPQSCGRALGRRERRVEGAFVVTSSTRLLPHALPDPHRGAQPAHDDAATLPRASWSGRHPLARAAAGELAQVDLQQDLRQDRRRVSVGGVGSARPHAVATRACASSCAPRPSRTTRWPSRTCSPTTRAPR